MTSAIASVIIASAQSVGKVYVIGAVGFFAVTCELNLNLMQWNYQPSCILQSDSYCVLSRLNNSPEKGSTAA